MTDIKTLIDPTASVIDRNSSIRAISLIHRSLISHLVFLKSQSWPKSTKDSTQKEYFDIEYNSTAQLVQDIGAYLKTHEDA